MAKLLRRERRVVYMVEVKNDIINTWFLIGAPAETKTLIKTRLTRFKEEYKRALQNDKLQPKRHYRIVKRTTTETWTTV